MKQTLTSTINRTVEIPLRICGIWPGSPYIPFCRLFWTIALVASQYLQYRYIILNLYTVDLSDLMDGLSATLSFSQLSSKLIIFWFNQRTFDKILTMMEMDWKENSGADFSIRVRTNKAILSHYFAKTVFSIFSIAVTLYSAASVFTFDTSDLEETDISMRPLILKMDFPFKSNTRFVYGLVLVAQFFCLVLCGCTFVTLNVLVVALVLHLAGQIEILGKWFTKIISEENGHRLNLTMMRKIIEKHQSIITFSKSIENLYSDVALVLFVSDSLIMCCIAFVMVTSIGSPNAATIIVKCFGFYLMINFEVFIFCFAGEYLSSKSRAIGDAAYDSRWYQCRFQDSRIFLFLIMRSQNQLTITVGKFMDLSLERYVSIVKASASYVSVMLAVY